MKAANQTKKMRDDELKIELGNVRTKLFDLRSQTVTEKVQDTSQFKKLRREAARILTEQNARRARAGK